MQGGDGGAARDHQLQPIIVPVHQFGTTPGVISEATVGHVVSGGGFHAIESKKIDVGTPMAQSECVGNSKPASMVHLPPEPQIIREVGGIKRPGSSSHMDIPALGMASSFTSSQESSAAADPLASASEAVNRSRMPADHTANTPGTPLNSGAAESNAGRLVLQSIESESDDEDENAIASKGDASSAVESNAEQDHIVEEPIPDIVPLDAMTLMMLQGDGMQDHSSSSMNAGSSSNLPSNADAIPAIALGPGLGNDASQGSLQSQGLTHARSQSPSAHQDAGDAMHSPVPHFPVESKRSTSPGVFRDSRLDSNSSKES